MLELQINADAVTMVSVKDDVIRVDLVNIGEGLCGDYNPNDPDDIELLRFDVYVSNPDGDEEYNTEWLEMEDASYCTMIPANAPMKTLIEKAKLIHKRYREKIASYEDYLYGPSVKKLGEELSWIAA